jgi:hypothetical protein
MSAEDARVRSRLDDLAAHFTEWVAPTLDAANIYGERRAVYEAIHQDLKDRLAKRYADIVRAAPRRGKQTPKAIARLRRETRKKITALYAESGNLGAVTLRCALLDLYDGPDRIRSTD